MLVGIAEFSLASVSYLFVIPRLLPHPSDLHPLHHDALGACLKIDFLKTDPSREAPI